MMNFEIDVVDILSDILERNPGVDIRTTFWAPSNQLKIVFSDYQSWINIVRLVNKDSYKDICNILLDMEQEYQLGKEKK